MKRHSGLLIVVSLLLAAVAAAGEPEDPKRGNGACRLEGAWYGASGFGPWTAVIVEDTPNSGTVTTQWTGGTGTWFGLCPGSVRNSVAIGSWSRTGPRAFEFTEVTFSLDVDGFPVCMWKSVGWGELDAGCASGWLNAAIEFFAPGQNPFEDEPYYTIPPGDPNNLFRVPVQQYEE
jgi:hypothetical protein